MRSFYLLSISLLLTSCAAERAAESMLPAGQVFAAAGLANDSTPPPSPLSFGGGGKYKFNGPVTFTIQQGQGNTATSTALTKPKGPVASAPAAVATETQQAATSWYWFLVAAVCGAAGWEWLSSQVSWFKWLPWRARVG